MAPDLPERTRRYREQYRAEVLPRRYSGRLHFGGVTVICLAVVAAALAGLRAPSALELASAPLWFLMANLAEYLGHRGPMHHRRPGLGRVFERHTQQHHRFFTEDAMAGEGHRDFHITLFPPVLLGFFLGGIGAPIAALLYWTTTTNLALVFLAVVVGYFLAYEWVHLACHAPPESPLSRLPGVARARAHHAAHHDPRKMLHYNFNISFPVFDALMGTTWRGQPAPRAPDLP